MGSKADDTLKTLRLTKNTSGRTQGSDSPPESCADGPLDGSGSEDSVVSGPSSPSAAHHSLRCRECERLFSRMRRQEPLRKKQRDKSKHFTAHFDNKFMQTWIDQNNMSLKVLVKETLIS